MAYERQNFTDGKVLNAEQLIKIEDGIIQNEDDIKKKADLENGKLKSEQLPDNLLTDEALPNAVNDALAQAKESGVFNGEKGDPFTYEDFTPEQLEELKGEPFTYEDFTEEQLRALEGKTPEKGVDYFTAEDKSELVTDVLNALPEWQGGAY